MAADRSTAGSMQLHALRKHGEHNYLSLFQETHEEKREKGAPWLKENNVKTPKKVNNDNWRLLRSSIPEEKAAIRAGFVEINAVNGIDPAEWEVR